MTGSKLHKLIFNRGLLLYILVNIIIHVYESIKYDLEVCIKKQGFLIFD